MSKQSSRPKFPAKKRDEIVISDQYIYNSDENFFRKRLCITDIKYDSVTLIAERTASDTNKYQVDFLSISKEDFNTIAEVIAGS